MRDVFSLYWKKKNNVHTAQPIYNPCIPAHAYAASVFGIKRPVIDHKTITAKDVEWGREV